MSIHVAFRVDASSQIGTGHLMRCLALADNLKKNDVHIRFVSRYMPEHFQHKLAEDGYELKLLNNSQNNVVSDDLNHSNWLGTSQQDDAQNSIRALSDKYWDWIVVDHYALDNRWESALRQITKNILAIDDIADRAHDCDLLLDQNFYMDMQTRYAGIAPDNCQLLLGPRFALLRDEFRQMREQLEPRGDQVKRILIFFGGVDADNYTAIAIEALAEIAQLGIFVDVVIGVQHPRRLEIEAACRGSGFNCHVQTSKMAELMAAADLAIGAGGSAVWERCCLGLPTLTVSTVGNQSKQVTDAASAGLIYAAEVRNDLASWIKRHLIALVENGCLRNLLGRNGIQVVDGLGTSRVTEAMIGSDIRMRVAEGADSRSLFEWRNHPVVRAASHDNQIISWEKHQTWLASVLTSGNRFLLIGEYAGLPVGVVRFDVEDDEAELSIYLIQNTKQSGRGKSLLLSAERWFAVNGPKISKLRANVLEGNQRSHDLFARAGYQVESISYIKRP